MTTTQAKCTRCGGKATGDSFEDARYKIDHAIGLSRGKPCADDYNRVIEVVDKTVDESKTVQSQPESIGLDDALKVPYTSETPKDNDQDDSLTDTVEEKEIPFDAKPSKKKSKKFSY